MTLGICHTCGTTAPIEWFLSEAEHKMILPVLIALPKSVQGVVFYYLSLFKPQSGRAMATSKAVRLMTELRDLINNGYIQHGTNVARSCPPSLWVLAMEQMVERRDRLSLPLPNHNYLKAIAWDLADREDAKVEKNKKRILRTVGKTQVPVTITNPLDDYIQGLRDDKPTEEEMNEWRKQRMSRS